MNWLAVVGFIRGCGRGSSGAPENGSRAWNQHVRWRHFEHGHACRSHSLAHPEPASASCLALAVAPERTGLDLQNAPIPCSPRVTGHVAARSRPLLFGPASQTLTAPPTRAFQDPGTRTRAQPSQLKWLARLLLLLRSPLLHQRLSRLLLRVLLSVHAFAHICLLDRERASSTTVLKPTALCCRVACSIALIEPIE
jgi:hypothetical protein